MDAWCFLVRCIRSPFLAASAYLAASFSVGQHIDVGVGQREAQVVPPSAVPVNTVWTLLLPDWLQPRVYALPPGSRAGQAGSDRPASLLVHVGVGRGELVPVLAARAGHGP